MEGSLPHCDFWTISKMSLCGKRWTQDKTSLPLF